MDSDPDGWVPPPEIDSVDVTTHSEPDRLCHECGEERVVTQRRVRRHHLTVAVLACGHIEKEE